MDRPFLTFARSRQSTWKKKDMVDDIKSFSILMLFEYRIKFMQMLLSLSKLNLCEIASMCLHVSDKLKNIYVLFFMLNNF